MTGLFLFLPLLIIGPAAVWALRTGGLRRLWSVAGLMLLAIVVLSLAVSILYSVPSRGRVVIYALALLAPSVLFAATFLTLLSRTPRPTPYPVIIAYAGSVLGLVVGLLIVVYGLRVW